MLCHFLPEVEPLSLLVPYLGADLEVAVISGYLFAERLDHFSDVHGLAKKLHFK